MWFCLYREVLSKPLLSLLSSVSVVFADSSKLLCIGEGVNCSGVVLSEPHMGPLMFAYQSWSWWAGGEGVESVLSTEHSQPGRAPGFHRSSLENDSSYFVVIWRKLPCWMLKFGSSLGTVSKNGNCFAPNCPLKSLKYWIFLGLVKFYF